MISNVKTRILSWAGIERIFRERLSEPGVPLSTDGRRRLLPPAWDEER